MVDFSYVCLDKLLTSPLVVRRRRRPRSFALSRRLRQRRRSTTMTTTTTMMLSRRWLPLAHALTAIGCMFTRHRTVSFSHSRLSTQYSSLPETHSSYTLRGWITSSFFELCFSLFGTPPTRTLSAPSIQPYEEEKQDFPALSSIHWPDTLLASFFCYFVSFSISLCLSFRSVSPAPHCFLFLCLLPCSSLTRCLASSFVLFSVSRTLPTLPISRTLNRTLVTSTNTHGI